MTTTETLDKLFLELSQTAATRIYTVCREATRELIIRVEAESDYDARYVASRMTAWPLEALTTQVKPIESEPGIWVAAA